MQYLHITSNSILKIAQNRDLTSNTISFIDRNSLYDLDTLEIVFKKDRVLIGNIAGSFNLSSGLKLEILPKFKDELDSLREYREKFLNLISLEFDIPNYSLLKSETLNMTLNEALIYLFGNALLNELLSKPIPKVDMELLKLLKAIASLFSSDEHLSYVTSYLLSEILEIVKSIEPIDSLSLDSFKNLPLNEGNLKLELLIKEIEPITKSYIKYREKESNIWGVYFDLNYLFSSLLSFILNQNRVIFEKDIEVKLFESEFETISINIPFLAENREIFLTKWILDFQTLEQEILKLTQLLTIYNSKITLLIPKYENFNDRVFKSKLFKDIEVISIDFNKKFEELIDLKLSKPTIDRDILSDSLELLYKWLRENLEFNSKIDIEKISELKLYKVESIPSYLKHLKSLKYLEIAETDIESISQVAIDNFENLSYLKIRNNRYLLKIPNLSKLKNLEELNIGANLYKLNELFGYIEKFQRLKRLNLSSNMIFSLNFESPFNLIELNLSSNPLTTYSLNGLLNLEILNLSNCNLKHLFDISYLSKLKSLTLSSNSFREFPNSIYKLENLIDLDISKNLIGSISPAISNFSYLKSLNLSSNALTSLPSTISELILLEFLDISNNYFYKFPPILVKLMVKNSNLKIKIGDISYSSVPTHLRDRVF